MGDTGILLLSRHSGQGLEPMAEVRHAQTLGPLHHCISDNVSCFLVQLDVRVFPGFYNLVIPIGEEGTPDLYANLGTLFCSMSSLNECIPNTSSMRMLAEEAIRRDIRCLP